MFDVWILSLIQEFSTSAAYSRIIWEQFKNIDCLVLNSRTIDSRPLVVEPKHGYIYNAHS